MPSLVHPFTALQSTFHAQLLCLSSLDYHDTDSAKRGSVRSACIYKNGGFFYLKDKETKTRNLKKNGYGLDITEGSRRKEQKKWQREKRKKKKLSVLSARMRHNKLQMRGVEIVVLRKHLNHCGKIKLAKILAFSIRISQTYDPVTS